MSALVRALLRSGAERSSSKAALVVPRQGISWSFAELEERVTHLATHLRGGGSKYLLDNGYDRCPGCVEPNPGVPSMC